MAEWRRRRRARRRRELQKGHIRVRYCCIFIFAFVRFLMLTTHGNVFGTKSEQRQHSDTHAHCKCYVLLNGMSENSEQFMDTLVDMCVCELTSCSSRPAAAAAAISLFYGQRLSHELFVAYCTHTTYFWLLVYVVLYQVSIAATYDYTPRSSNTHNLCGILASCRFISWPYYIDHSLQHTHT